MEAHFSVVVQFALIQIPFYSSRIVDGPCSMLYASAVAVGSLCRTRNSRMHDMNKLHDCIDCIDCILDLPHIIDGRCKRAKFSPTLLLFTSSCGNIFRQLICWKLCVEEFQASVPFTPISVAYEQWNGLGRGPSTRESDSVWIFFAPIFRSHIFN